MYNVNEEEAKTVAVEASQSEASYQFGLFNGIPQFARVSMCSHIDELTKLSAEQVLPDQGSHIRVAK